MSRLTTEFWIGAYLAQLRTEGIPAYLPHRGDPQAGAVLVKLAFMNGKASLFTRHYGPDGHLVWHAEPENRPEPEIDDAIRRRLGYDRDLWVVEIEDPGGRHLLDRPGLED
ncbi:DUF1491 family protein [Paralimibaculum aggregatum]|uniref:DUF1491 family protein n=1 Tax=Paralimibaculum aggregatum TaxID=3036245 RepID=A0ABQ6LJX6_9RHOB|nr:DUF1491 family protein [Limibaculum sp. NKW23]GMG80969.1 DUF1491 family protein [Limibaculum sp. NKW23]